VDIGGTDIIFPISVTPAKAFEVFAKEVNEFWPNAVFGVFEGRIVNNQPYYEVWSPSLIDYSKCTEMIIDRDAASAAWVEAAGCTDENGNLFIHAICYGSEEFTICIHHIEDKEISKLVERIRSLIS
jgi:hypothetical protein